MLQIFASIGLSNRHWLARLAERSPLRSAWLLPAIIGVAVGVRLIAAVAFGDGIADLPGVRDQLSYHTLALQVLAGHGFSFPESWWPATRPGEPTAHWSFLYTLFLTGTYAVVGTHPLAARLIQAAIVGILQPWLAARLSARLFGQSAGLIAAAIAAVYGYFIYYAAALMTESFFIVAILWSLDIAISLLRTPGANTRPIPSDSGRGLAGTLGPWVLLGIALGSAALLRQVVLLFVPVLFAWVIWGSSRRRPGAQQHSMSRNWRASAAGLLVTIMVIVGLIAPWTIRNYLAFDRFVLLNTNAGYAFFWANHPIYGTHFTAILPSEEYGQLIPADLLGLNEAALDQALLGEGLRFVTADPVRYAMLSLSRISDYFYFWPSAESGTLGSLARVFSFGALLPLVAYGLYLVARRSTPFVAPERGYEISLLVLFVLVYTAIHLLSWALVRYRLPVDAALIPFASVALVDLGRRLPRAPHEPGRPELVPDAVLPGRPGR